MPIRQTDKFTEKKFEIVLKKQPLYGKTNKVFSLRKLVKQKKPNTKIVNTFIFIF